MCAVPISTAGDLGSSRCCLGKASGSVRTRGSTRVSHGRTACLGCRPCRGWTAPPAAGASPAATGRNRPAAAAGAGGPPFPAPAGRPSGPQPPCGAARRRWRQSCDSCLRRSRSTGDSRFQKSKSEHFWEKRSSRIKFRGAIGIPTSFLAEFISGGSLPG